MAKSTSPGLSDMSFFAHCESTNEFSNSKETKCPTYLSRNLKIKDVFPYKLKLKVKVKKELILLRNDTEFTNDNEFIFEGKLTEFLLPRTNILDSSPLDNGTSSC